ncbi:hypothetical protein L7F22_031342 [Adiantum nelumboides]|nr:hypothetical protein [Adiantum nelumboides]
MQPFDLDVDTFTPSIHTRITQIATKVQFSVQQAPFERDFLVSPLTGCDMLIGNPWMTTHVPLIDSKSDTFFITEGVPSPVTITCDRSIRGIPIISHLQAKRAIRKGAECALLVNKPFLPVAAGDLSVPAAWVLVVSLALLGIAIVATNFGLLITALYSFGLFLGAIYSVPPLRLKRFAVAAFLIIATVRGFLLNFGVYYATRASLGLTYTWSPPILFITTFVTIFATVIAITKDLADVEGDRQFQISTFATKLGVRNITFLSSGLLLLNYIGAIVAACIYPEVTNFYASVFSFEPVSFLIPVNLITREVFKALGLSLTRRIKEVYHKLVRLLSCSAKEHSAKEHFAALNELAIVA